MRIPSSTYRVQLHQQFSFEELKAIIPYLHDLGISAIYAAPIGSATPGSMHGYDVTDPNRINPEVGTRKEMREIFELLREKGMIWIQDIVPNHMAFSTHNTRLMDVLERGPVSPYYRYFDIDWEHESKELYGKLMVPFLGKEISECLRDGEINLSINDSGVSLSYFDNDYPVNGPTYEFLASRTGTLNHLREALLDIHETSQKQQTMEEWSEFKTQWRRKIEKSGLAPVLTALLKDVSKNQTVMLQILDMQHYRLTFWKNTEREINYRRFFTVNSLICLRMGEQFVFDDYHKLVRYLFSEGMIQGVRIDHIDGLNDPAEYLERLRKLLGDECYIIAEKILESEEVLPEDWPIQGTSGYEFLSTLNKLFTDPKGSGRLVEFYQTLVKDVPPYEQLVQRNKKLILEKHMAGELDNMIRYFVNAGLCGRFERQRMKDALAAFMLALPVYRIYPGELPLTGIELELVEGAFHKALHDEASLSDELHHLRWLFVAPIEDGTLRESALRFLKRLMQFTGPLTAKGVEDTTFYIYNPLISHDEVGDDPSVLGTSVRDFHRKMIVRQQTMALSLNASATHDTKRGEDARVRLNVLSEIPDVWIAKVREWMSLNEPFHQVADGLSAPSVNDEYFLYQSVLGGFPEDCMVSDEWIGRVKEYLVKAMREAKVRTNWESPNEAYEKACIQFTDKILEKDSPFLQSFVPFAKHVIGTASIYSVIQAVIKLTAPGIPDIYQGCELWDLSYVDPDNRRPVDYKKRSSYLQQLREAFPAGFEKVAKILRSEESGGIKKLFASWRLLNFRKDYPELFREGTYLPLTQLSEGNRAIGYARYYEGQWCLVVAPFLLARKKSSDDIELKGNFIFLPPDSPLVWRNVFTDKVMEVSENGLSIDELLSDFPVAVMYNI